MIVTDRTAQAPQNLCWNLRPANWLDDPALDLHHTGSTSERGDLDWVMGGAARDSLKRLGTLDAAASCHKLFHRNGDISVIVREDHRAYHAGLSRMPLPDGRFDCNDFSIGYEICNNGAGELYTQAQYVSLAHSIAYDCTRFHIRDRNITTHKIIRDAYRARYGPNSAAPKNDPYKLDIPYLMKLVAGVRANWPYGSIFPVWQAA